MCCGLDGVIIERRPTCFAEHRDCETSLSALIREGDAAQELFKVIEPDADIPFLVLAAGFSSKGPANPRGLDLDWRWRRRAMAFGCMARTSCAAGGGTGLGPSMNAVRQ